MEKAYDEAGPDLDLEKVKCIAGSTGEKIEKLVELHTDLAGVEDALKERETLNQHREMILNRNRGGAAHGRQGCSGADRRSREGRTAHQ